MRLRPTRHSFAFLALFQSVLVLLGVVYLFNWFESTGVKLIRGNSLETTQATASQIDGLFRNLRETKEQANSDIDKQWVEKFRRATEGFKRVQDTCVFLVRNLDGTILSHRNKPVGFDDRLSLGNVPFQPVFHDDATTLVSSFSLDATVRAVSGVLSVDGQQWVGSARRWDQAKCILLVMRNDSARLEQQAAAFSQKRTRALLGALGLSFLAIAVPIVGLHHNDGQLRATNNNLERQATHNERELTRTRNAVIFGLAKLAESRDNDTGEHLERIRKYVEIISRDLANHCEDVDEEFTRNISLASSLHDIGKVGIPDSILLKPGRLTPEERSMLQFHTLIGGECLDAIHSRLGSDPFMHMARQIAYYHHERWDGNGYPHQLKEYDIPLVARIVAVADVYDALTSKRPYKRAMSHLESRAIIVTGSGSQFDPEVVAAFIRHEGEFEAISRAQQSLSDDQATSVLVKLHGKAQAVGKKKAQTC